MLLSHIVLLSSCPYIWRIWFLDEWYGRRGRWMLEDAILFLFLFLKMSCFLSPFFLFSVNKSEFGNGLCRLGPREKKKSKIKSQLHRCFEDGDGIRRDIFGVVARL
ncbi:hypothetical protein V8C37DRAFT_385224 [Trichoderma ceciliae]